jgi:hypothetical protein
MKLPRYVGIVDLGIATVLLVAIALPPREMYASAAMKAPEDEQFALALAEARTMAQPEDGMRSDELSHKLGMGGFKDWAIEAGIDGAERGRQSPTRWRSFLAASVAYVERLDAVPGLDYANRAIAACETIGAPACPDWEAARMKLYQQALDAGVKKGIDPRKNPRAFRKAGENLIIHIGGTHDTEQQQTPAPSPAPAPAP